MKWFNNLKLSTKINLINGSIIIIIFVISGYILLNNVYKTSITQAKKAAITESINAANRVKYELETAKAQLLVLHDTILYIKDTQSLSRQKVIEFLKIILEHNPNMLGIYTIWEPDKFDGKDKQYANTTYHDKTGRFIPYIVRNNNTIIIEPLYDYEVEGIGDWYLLPKKTKQITLTEPFYYQIGDKKYLIISLTVPLLDEKGQFIGIVGADYQVDFLQKFIQTIKPLKGYSFLLSHKGVYIAHSLRPNVIMKKLRIQDKNLKLLETIRQDKSFMYFDKSIATGNEVLRVFYPIHIDGVDSHWSLCINISKDVILANYYIYFRLICLALVLSIIVLILLNIVSVSNIISKRLYYIVNVLNQLAKGNFNFQIEKSSYLDEIGDLHRSAELLQKDLSNYIMDLQAKEEELTTQNEELLLAEQELQKERNSLELKVQQRTNELKESLDRLEKANNHKSNFLSTMSHELRTPLNAIIGFSDLLKKQYYGELNQKQLEYTDLILNSSNHLLDLINDILDITKIDSGTIELDKHEINIHNLLNEVQSLMLSQFNEKRIHLSCYIDNELELIILDERKFKQILINLLSNALKFTENGKHVEINILKLNDNQFKVSVKDTGIGINNNEKDKIFDKFYQINNKGYKTIGGTGLGLTIVKRFIEIQGGEIFVESEPGIGSNFWFILPLN